MPIRWSSLPLERDDVDVVGRRIEMQLQVDQRGGGVFDGREALVEAPRADELVEQRLGHRLAGLVMDREAAKHLRLLEPVLVELRGKLDEVARDASSGQDRIGHVRQHPVQRVAEFVEQGARIVEAQEARLALAALGEIHDVDHDRQLRRRRASPGRGNCSSRRRCVSRPWRNSRRRRARWARRRGRPPSRRARRDGRAARRCAR